LTAATRSESLIVVTVRRSMWVLPAWLLCACGGGSLSTAGLGDAGADASSPAKSLRAQLAGAWAFDGDGKDHSVNGFELDTSELHFVAGQFGKGLQFAGDGTPIAQRPRDDAALNLATGDFTVSFWVSFAATGTPQFVAIKGYDPGWFVGWAQTEWAFGLPSPAGGTFVGSPGTGAFHHVVLERTGNTVEMFVDETSIGTKAVTDGQTVQSAFQVGGYAPGGVSASRGQKVVNGVVDDLAIWHRAIFPDERAWLGAHAVP
jgi:hypothetical protein